MKFNETQSNWQHYRAQVRLRWPTLTDAEIDEVAGNREKLAQKLQATGATPEQVEQQIKDFENTMKTPPGVNAPAPQGGRVAQPGTVGQPGTATRNPHTGATGTIPRGPGAPTSPEPTQRPNNPSKRDTKPGQR